MKKKFSQDQHSFSDRVQYRANEKSLIDIISKAFTVLKLKTLNTTKLVESLMTQS